MWVEVNHNVFERRSIMRRSCSTSQTCRECGRPAKFQYAYRNDDSLRGLVVGTDYVFCTIGCWRAYS